MSQAGAPRRLGLRTLLLTAATGLGSAALWATPVSAHALVADTSVDRPCGETSPWTGSVRASSGTYQAVWTVAASTSTGVTVPAGEPAPVTTVFTFDFGPFPAELAAVDVTLRSTWYKAVRTVERTNVVTLVRPATTACPTTEVAPVAPAVAYDCAADELVVSGADDTDTIDYTVSTSAPTGEDGIWGVTITAAPRPGYTFADGAPTEWVLTGTADCDEPAPPVVAVTPPAPSIACLDESLAVDAVDGPGYAFTVDGDLDAAEGSAYEITVVAVPTPGHEFPADAATTWVFTGTVDCVTTSQRAPAAPTTTVPPTPTTTPPAIVAVTDVARTLPATGAGALTTLAVLAAALTAAGGLLMTARRRTTHA